MDATVTLQELVYSGYLSHGAFVFGNETENIQHNDGNIAKDIEGRQQILNSAKISLMLTKKISESIQNENDEKNENNNSQTSLRLKNILVKLSKICPEVGHAAGSDATQNKYPDETTNNNTYPHTQAENSSQILSSKNNELGESTIDDSIRSDSSSVMIEGFLSEVEWPAVKTNGRDEKKHYENEGEVNPPPDSILDFFGTISHCSDTADPNNYEPCTDGGVNEQLKTSTYGTRWILLGMEINAPDDVLDTAQTSVQDSMYDLPMQILGNIFYSIFSLDKEQLFQSFRKEELACSRIIEVNDDFDESSPRISKNRRNADTSLFSHLLESGKCPISVCRLISDMIDADGDGDSKADSPVNSLDEVIHDLEQMINYPNTFLYDPDNEFYSSKLHFGHSYYGRKAEVTKLLDIAGRMEELAKDSLSISGTNAVFVSGLAGSGKTHLAQKVGTFLSNLGWIYAQAKFERETEHGSQGVVISLFENLVASIVTMKDGSASDVEFMQCAANSISVSMNEDSVRVLGGFIPSIHALVSNAAYTNKPDGEPERVSHWRLGFLLSRLLAAILRVGRFVIFCLDDLQWSDSAMLKLIKEFIISAGELQHGKNQFLFVGTHRDIEATDSHPLTNQLTDLQQNQSVDVTEMKLAGLSKEDVATMLMMELRIPRRLVLEFSDIVYKKTSGHTIFVVQLLNSLVCNSMIAYSPQKRRFHWNLDKILLLKTCDSVADLIVSNLSYLQPEALQALRILSCFGIKSHLSLLDLLETFPSRPRGGVISYLPSLFEEGILEEAGTIITFAHDLIQQQVYEHIPPEQQRKLHLELGTFLGSKTSLDNNVTIDISFEQLYLSDKHSTDDPILLPSSLVAVATEQINKVCPEFIQDREKFARWNLEAGKLSLESSNFRVASYFFDKGIAFLGEGLWSKDAHTLSLQLNEGRANTLYALGQATDAGKCASSIIEKVPFEDSLNAQLLLIRSFDCNGENDRAISKAIEVLRELGVIDFPSDPSPATFKNAIIKTIQEASRYDYDEIPHLHQDRLCEKSRIILKIMDAVTIACFRRGTRYLPLLASAMVSFSLNHGVCKESASAFAVFGYFSIYVLNNFEEARRHGNIALKILQRTHTQSVLARLVLFAYVSVWFIPVRVSSRHLFESYKTGMLVGDVANAMQSLYLSLRFAFFAGDKLSVLSRSYDKYLASMVKYSIESAKAAVMNKILINDLTGNTVDPFFVFNGLIPDEHFLLADAKSRNNVLLIENIHQCRFFIAFYNGDYAKAEEIYEVILSFSTSQAPRMLTIQGTFLRGLISFQLYRDGQGEEWQSKGKTLLDKMEPWLQKSKSLFENKVLLLRAEHLASIPNISDAIEMYNASIKSARDHGHIHEEGLAYEFMGNFFASIVESTEATRCYKNAHRCYMIWGAVAKADKIWKDHQLDHFNGIEPRAKHGRD